MAAQKYAHINFTPPKAVQAAARRGLEWRKKYGRGGLSNKEASKQGIGSGVQRAVNLANGNAVSPETIGRMVSFFARHEKNKDSTMPNGEPGAGKVAWALWGGSPGKQWSEKVKRQMAQADMAKKSLTETAKAILIYRGAAGSGNWGHAGRPGKLGGSSSGGGLKRIGARPDSSHQDRQKASKKARGKRKAAGGKTEAKPKAEVRPKGAPKEAAKTGGDKLDSILKNAPKDQAAFTGHLMEKVQSGEITFGEAQELRKRFGPTQPDSAKKKFDPADVKGDVPRGREYSGNELVAADKQWSGWAGKLAKNEREALIDYQSEPFDDRATDYTKINAHLRGQDNKPTKPTRDAVSRMDKALNKSSLKEDTVVYRGFPPSVLGDDPGRLVGSTIRDKAYVSTSLDRKVAEQFGRVVAEVRLPKGTKGALLDSLKSGKDQEYEFLLPRDQQFRILSVNKSGNRTNVVMELVQ